MSTKTDVNALFDAVGPAYDEVQAKTEKRDKLAAELQAAHDKLVSDLAASDAKAAAALDAANQALKKATDDLSAVQAQLNGVLSKVMPGADPRLRR